MNVKDLKFLQLFEKLCNLDYLGDKTAVEKIFGDLIAFDFLKAMDAWEYVVTTHEDKLTTEKKFAEIAGVQLFNMFLAARETAVIKAVTEIPAIRRAVFLYSPSAGEAKAFEILLDAVVTGKAPRADEILKCLVKNDNVKFDKLLKNLIEKAFVKIKAKSGKVILSKPTLSLLRSFVNKIKTDTKEVLVQRLKEVE